MGDTAYRILGPRAWRRGVLVAPAPPPRRAARPPPAASTTSRSGSSRRPPTASASSWSGAARPRTAPWTSSSWTAASRSSGTPSRRPLTPLRRPAPARGHGPGHRPQPPGLPHGRAALNLDAKLWVQMRTTVARLQNQLGTTTVYVTHDQTEAMTLGDRVAVMRAGVIQQVGTPEELYERPRNLFVAGFIGSPAMNFLPGTLEDGHLRTALGNAALPSEVRAEGLTFSAVVDVLESLGAEQVRLLPAPGPSGDGAGARGAGRRRRRQRRPGWHRPGSGPARPGQPGPRGPAAPAVVRPRQAAPVQPGHRGPPHPVRPLSGPRGRSARPGRDGGRPRPREASAWSGCCARASPPCPR